ISVLSGATATNHVLTITEPSMSAGANQTVSITVRADTGLTIDTSRSHLSFQYLGATLNGTPANNKLVVNVDATTRYTIPIGVGIVIALLAVIYVRRQVGTVVKP